MHHVQVKMLQSPDGCAVLDRYRNQKASQAKESLGGRRVIGEDDDAHLLGPENKMWVKCLFDPVLKA